MAIGAAIVTAVAGAASVAESRKARKDRERARRIQEKSKKLQVGRQAVEQVRQAQIARAEVIQAGETAGVGDSSAIRGAAGSIQSQAGGNIGFAQQIFDLSIQAGRRLESAARHDFRSQAFSSLASMSSKFIGGGAGGSGGASANSAGAGG